MDKVKNLVFGALGWFAATSVGAIVAGAVGALAVGKVSAGTLLGAGALGTVTAWAAYEGGVKDLPASVWAKLTGSGVTGVVFGALGFALAGLVAGFAATALGVFAVGHVTVAVVGKVALSSVLGYVSYVAGARDLPRKVWDTLTG